MKRLAFVLTIIFIAVNSISCTTSLPSRIEKFVDRVEKDCSSYSKEDWQNASEQFTKLMDQYDMSYDQLSKEDRAIINRSIGRFHATAVKAGINSIIDSFDDLFSLSSTLPARVQRFVDRVEKNSSSYTEEEWEKVSEQFTKLMEQYKESYDKLSLEDRAQINKSIGRYYAAVLGSGLKSIIKSFYDTLYGLSFLFEGFLGGMNSFLKELGIGAIN